MNALAETGSHNANEDTLLTLHISQVPENIGLIRIVKDLGNPNREVITDGSWSKAEIRRLNKEYPQLVIELQVTSEEKLSLLVNQVTSITEKSFTLEKMFKDVNAVKESLKERVREVFDDQIISFRNRMTMTSYGFNDDILTKNASSYSNLITYSTQCFVIGMLFAEYLDELSSLQRNVLGKCLILHKIGYIETMNDSSSLLDRTVAILESSGYERAIIQFAKNQGTVRFKNNKLKNLLRTTEIGKIVTHYCNCTVNYPRITPPFKTIEKFEEILEISGRRREMLFEPTLLTKFVEMIRKGLEMPVSR
ncbi:hypothetical protein UWK_02383 [Desulfocapsa sulfexigens DSM 10523]|uniref:Uncharacterized protein n=1 Tax=Desulfocapsa sulfexigens (strain DSM 10523 / SB164P1) TaxID=1167006 RepID=M1P638_DESSD|nr:hypothetical protein [Desulfocapsa sulfexigens]AGF78923.1 hypothetical protein UWK_02383 [Desulfocapsa sulfexigens DSM 10523]